MSKTKKRTVRAGTVRAKIINIADGKKTLDQVAKSVKSTRANLRTTLSCMKRDLGIKYELKDGELLVMSVPRNVQVGDAA
ncbi:hypothetical protein [Methyloceanibacter caenitepidi]|uniref:Uncharacterized protein n=1 Tax=Methyloceanibacter caenitepidi TaxID=1384459 RepID=A0A0A8K593_9HYPH|nr:hypothetical protein [Methyloceanibacter caenitepidi]BAQ17921.1 hypothetical protein GL4_2487 [Methyloceanibacter caenitepidi]